MWIGEFADMKKTNDDKEEENFVTWECDRNRPLTEKEKRQIRELKNRPITFIPDAYPITKTKQGLKSVSSMKVHPLGVFPDETELIFTDYLYDNDEEYVMVVARRRAEKGYAVAECCLPGISKWSALGFSETEQEALKAYIKEQEEDIFIELQKQI